LVGSNLNIYDKPENSRPSVLLEFKSVIKDKVLKKTALVFHEFVTN
jgi:hypothetical protein